MTERTKSKGVTKLLVDASRWRFTRWHFTMVDRKLFLEHQFSYKFIEIRIRENMKWTSYDFSGTNELTIKENMNHNWNNSLQIGHYIRELCFFQNILLVRWIFLTIKWIIIRQATRSSQAFCFKPASNVLVNYRCIFLNESFCKTDQRIIGSWRFNRPSEKETFSDFNK